MKRTLAILLPILAAITLAGVLIVLTRTGSWPTGIRPLEWRRVLRPAGEDTGTEPTAPPVEAAV